MKSLPVYRRTRQGQDKNRALNIWTIKLLSQTITKTIDSNLLLDSCVTFAFLDSNFCAQYELVLVPVLYACISFYSRSFCLRPRFIIWLTFLFVIIIVYFSFCWLLHFSSFYSIYNCSFFAYFHRVLTFYLLRCLCLLIRSNLQYNICDRLSRGKLILTSWILIPFRFDISLYRVIYLY
jgi:hypothetical protein